MAVSRAPEAAPKARACPVSAPSAFAWLAELPAAWRPNSARPTFSPREIAWAALSPFPAAETILDAPMPGSICTMVCPMPVTFSAP